MKTLRYFLFALLLASIGCTYARQLAGTGPQQNVLPPVVVANVAKTADDETPIVHTKAGYVPAPIPGVPTDPPTAFQYKTYVGPSY